MKVVWVYFQELKCLETKQNKVKGRQHQISMPPWRSMHPRHPCTLHFINQATCGQITHVQAVYTHVCTPWVSTIPHKVYGGLSPLICTCYMLAIGQLGVSWATYNAGTSCSLKSSPLRLLDPWPYSLAQRWTAEVLLLEWQVKGRHNQKLQTARCHEVILTTAKKVKQEVKKESSKSVLVEG